MCNFAHRGMTDGFPSGTRAKTDNVDNKTGSSDLPVGRFVERCVESPLQKYFASPVGQIISTNSRHPTPPEGRIAIVTDAGWDAVDAAASCARRDRRAGSYVPVSDHQASGREMLQRTAKSCGPDTPTLVSSLRSCVGPTGLGQNISARRRWQKSPVTGESPT